MKCLKCEDRGFIEAPILMSAGNYGTILQCCNITKYSEEIQRRINLHSPKSSIDNQKKATQQTGVVLQLKRNENL